MDWADVFCPIVRETSYKLHEVGKLTYPQAKALLRDFNRRPYQMVVMIDPAKLPPA